MCPYSVEQAADLAELHAVSGQFRLKAALFTQQVRHQNTDQVGAAGTGQNLDLHTQFFPYTYLRYKLELSKLLKMLKTHQ